MHRSIAISLVVAVAAAGCESAARDAATSAPAAAEKVTAAGAPAKGGVTAARLDLEGIAAPIRDGTSKNAKDLEAQINKNLLNHVDVDSDGTRDRLQVVEERDGDAHTLVVRAVPSSDKKRDPDAIAVPLARIEVVPTDTVAQVTVRHTEVAVAPASEVIVFDAPLVVGTFCHWLVIIERPIYIGVARVIIVEEHVHTRHKHKKHKHKKHK